MKKLKHSKIKNTGLIFELLVKRLTSDVLNNIDSKAIPILKKHFGKDSILMKECDLYTSLVSERFTTNDQAVTFIDATVSKHSRLNQQSIRRSKYELVADLKEAFDLDEFFKTGVGNYKLLASAYTLLEYKLEDHPADIIRCKQTIIEHSIKGKSDSEQPTSNVINEDLLAGESSEVRAIAFKLMVDKFNSIYGSKLNESQIKVLRNYIYFNDSVKFKEFLAEECNMIKKKLKPYIRSVSDKVLQIKLNEVHSMIEAMQFKGQIKESHVSKVLQYHELLQELKAI